MYIVRYTLSCVMSVLALHIIVWACVCHVGAGKDPILVYLFDWPLYVLDSTYSLFVLYIFVYYHGHAHVHARALSRFNLQRAASYLPEPSYPPLV